MKVLIQAANGRIQYPVPTLVGLGGSYFIVITTWSCLLSGIAFKSIRSIIDYCPLPLAGKLGRRNCLEGLGSTRAGHSYH